jgi:hypothetical protein
VQLVEAEDASDLGKTIELDGLCAADTTILPALLRPRSEWVFFELNVFHTGTEVGVTSP